IFRMAQEHQLLTHLIGKRQRGQFAAHGHLGGRDTRGDAQRTPGNIILGAWSFPGNGHEQLNGRTVYCSTSPGRFRWLGWTGKAVLNAPTELDDCPPGGYDAWAKEVAGWATLNGADCCQRPCAGQMTPIISWPSTAPAGASSLHVVLEGGFLL